MIGRRLGAAFLLVLLGLVPVALGPSASGQPSDDEDRTAPAQPLARLEVDTLAPRIVTSSGPSTLTITGRIVNVGDRTITDPLVRVQRDVALTSADDARTALLGTSASVITEFTALDSDLLPGQIKSFALSVPIGAGPAQQALQITEPGVYPLLVNLNGTPDFGDTARLASLPLLLPVLGVPPPQPGGTPGPSVPARTAPVPLTIVWPITAALPRLATTPGQPLLLQSASRERDPLADQLAPGGRLDRLLGAVEQTAGPGSPLAAALCVAVDPALLDTVEGMQGGYRVAVPGGEVDGVGGVDATRWLERLRVAVAGRCVLPLPYGDPDGMALSRGGETDLLALGASSGERLTAELLGVRPLQNTAWPVDGVVDDRGLTDLTRLGTGTLLLEEPGLEDPPADTDRVALPAGGQGVQAVVADPLFADALSPVPSALDAEGVTRGGAVPAALGASGVSNRPAGTGGPLSAQDGIGALVFRALDPSGRPALVLPPRRWQLGPGEGTEFLRTAGQLLASGYFAPRDLTGLVAAATPVAEGTLSYPQAAQRAETAPAFVSEIGREERLLRDLQAATDRDATVGLEPPELFDPIRQAMLRALSAGYREDRGTGSRMVRDVGDRVDAVQSAVRLVPPPGPYTLASSDSPLLITIRNDLPVSMRVQLDLDETGGLDADDIGLQEIPALSNRQLVVPSDVSRSGRFSVDATLRTPGGTELGEPATLQLRSTAFGKVTVALTIGAGAVLVLLVIRRLYRRFRGRPASPRKVA